MQSREENAAQFLQVHSGVSIALELCTCALRQKTSSNLSPRNQSSLTAGHPCRPWRGGGCHRWAGWWLRHRGGRRGSTGRGGAAAEPQVGRRLVAAVRQAALWLAAPQPARRWASLIRLSSTRTFISTPSLKATGAWRGVWSGAAGAAWESLPSPSPAKFTLCWLLDSTTPPAPRCNADSGSQCQRMPCSGSGWCS